MITVRWLFLLMIGILMSGCISSEGIRDSLTQSMQNPKPLGLNLKETNTLYFQPVVQPNYFYGQLVIETNLKTNRIGGQSAQRLMRFVSDLFGASQEEIGVVLTPVVGDIRLPPLVPFSYRYDQSAKVWEMHLNRKYVSPFVLLGNNTKLRYELEYAASASSKMSLNSVIDGILEITGPINPGAWAISALSKPLLDKTIAQVEKGLNTFLQNSRKSKVNDEFLPANDGVRGKTIMLYNSDDEELAQIDITVRLTNSLLNPILDGQVSSDYRQAVPKLDPHTNPLNVLHTAWQGDSPPLSQSLGPKVDALMAAQQAQSFRGECRRILDILEGEFALSKFDALNAMRHVLRNTLFTRNQQLYESGCLADEELELLAQMGVAFVFEQPPKMAFQAFLYDDIGNYSRSPESVAATVKHRLLKTFADQVMVNNNTDVAIFQQAGPATRYTPEQVLEELARLRTARFCCYERPQQDSRELPNGVRMVMRPRDSLQLLQVEFYRGLESPAFDYILLRPALEDEISPARHRSMMEPVLDESLTPSTITP